MTTEKHLAVRKAAERAHVIFEREVWTWHGDPNPPTVGEIASTYYMLIDSARGYGSASTGRLTVLETDLGIELLVNVGDYYERILND